MGLEKHLIVLDLDDLMDFSVRAAEGAGRVTLAHFGSVSVDFKEDGSEVTVADMEAEEYIRRVIGERFPEHGVLGEESVRVESQSPYRWIVDPIDGTRSFAAGVPLYGILIALEHAGIPLLGCCHFPALGDTVVAAVGAGCWRGDQPARVSACGTLREARVITSGLEYWRDWATPAGREGFDRLVQQCRFVRTWGDCFGYMLVATGRAEVIADPACGAHWDYAPMVPILAEAGGRFTTLRERPVRAWSSALATNGHLHRDASSCWDLSPDDRAIQVPEILQRG